MLHDKDKLKQTIFILALFVLGGILFWLLQGFLSAFLAAVVFYILLRQPLFYLTEKTKGKWSTALAAVFLMFISFIVLVLPVLLVSLMLSGKISYVVHHYEDILRITQEWSAQAKDYIGTDILTPESTGKFAATAAGFLPKLISATAKALIDIFVLYFILFFMLSNAKTVESKVREFLPFKQENNRLLLHELKRQTLANSMGIAVLSVIQAFLSFIAYWAFGVSEPGFWAILTGLASAIPVVGTGIVWVPLSIVQYASGQHWQSYAVALYCAVVLAAVENIFRILVLKKIGDVHPLITFFGVIIGIDIFGIVGIIFGPLLISYFILLLRIYRNEYMEDAAETTAG